MQFQWVPNIRQGGPEAMYKRFADVIDGKHVLRSLSPPVGSLVFFQGSETLHQVSTVLGDTPRISLVFAFAPSADFKNSDLVKDQNSWGKKAGE